MATVQEMPISATGVTSEIASERANWVVVRNSRVLVGIVYFGSLCSYAMGVCFLLIALGTLTSHAFRWGNPYAAATWVIAGLSTILSGPWLWSLGRKMAFNEARLDSRGVDFRFAPRKAPQELFMAWEQISAIRQSRSGNSQVFTVTGTDGSEATFTSYTFFRPKKLAKMIAARAGITIQRR